MCILSLQIYLFWIFHVNRIIWKVVFVTSFFHFAYSQRSSRLWHVLRLHSFLWPNTPLYGYATFYLSSHQLVDVLFVSTFWLLWIMLLWIIGVDDFVQTFIFSSFSYISKSRIAVSYGNSMFNFLRNCQTVFPSGTTILHVHQKCTRVPFSPYSSQYLLSFFLL